MNGKVVISEVVSINDAIVKLGACAPFEVKVKGDIFTLVVTEDSSNCSRGIVLNNVPELADVLNGNLGAIRAINISRGEFKIFGETLKPNNFEFGIIGSPAPNIVIYDIKSRPIGTGSNMEAISKFKFEVNKDDDGIYTLSFKLNNEKTDIIACELILTVDMEPIVVEEHNPDSVTCLK